MIDANGQPLPAEEAARRFLSGGEMMYSKRAVREIVQGLMERIGMLDRMGAALQGLLSAADAYSGSFDSAEADDVALMLRYGHATDEARDALRAIRSGK